MKDVCFSLSVCLSALVDECTPSPRLTEHSNILYTAILIPKWESIYYFGLPPPSHHVLMPFSRAFLSFFCNSYLCSHILLWILVLLPWDVLVLDSLLLPFKGFDITSTGYFLFFNLNLACLASMFWETLAFSGLRLVLFIIMCTGGNSELHMVYGESVLSMWVDKLAMMYDKVSWYRK